LYIHQLRLRLVHPNCLAYIHDIVEEADSVYDILFVVYLKYNELTMLLRHI